jgi:Ca2+-binding RTX toxin-like protein
LTATSVGFISGSGGNDTIQGAINGVAPGSTLEGGLGDDSIYSRGVGDIALGGPGNDIIRNDSGQASLIGGAGNDVISGEDQQTTVYGGVGNDSILFTDTENLAYGDAGNDTIIGLNGGDIFAGGDGNDYLEAATTGNDASILFGNKGNDTLILSDTAADSAFGGQDADYVFAGSDATADGQFLFGNYGDDVIEYLGNGDGVVIDGDRAIDGVGGYFPATGTDAGADSIILASSGTDFATNITIAGGAGDDSISGTLGAGAAVYMGKGDDFFNIVSSGSSLITGDLGNDSGSISLGGNDSLFGDGIAQGSDATLGDDNFVLTGSGGNFIFGDTETGTDGGNDAIDATGIGSGNVIYGGGGNDSLTSGGGNTLIGGAGNDVYSFGAGDVIPFDSLGINTYIAGSGASSSDVVTVQPGDSFTGGATFLVTGEAELIKSLTSGGVIASDERDLIEITNVDGVTSLKGGNDTFTGQDLAATGVVSGGDGDDQITFTGTSIAAGTIDGGAGNDEFIFDDPLANVGANISGGEGDDSLDVAGIFSGSFTGGDGVDDVSIDTIGAGASIDLGAGDERIAIGFSGTEAGAALVSGGAGNDTITVGSTDTTGTSLELTIDGGEGDDIIYGKASGGDSISGGAGNDTLFGGGFGFGSADSGTNVSNGLGDTLTGGAGADIFVLGTEGKLGYIVAGVGTASFGEEGFFFTGSSATEPGTGVFNGVFNADVITDFDPTQDTIVFNNAGSQFGNAVAGSFGVGALTYLSDDLVTTGDYFGSDGTTGANNSFGLLGEAGSAGFAIYDLPFGTGYEPATTTSGSAATRSATLSTNLPIGFQAFMGTDAGSFPDTTAVTSIGTADSFFSFTTSGTGSGEIAAQGLTYDTGNGALYYDAKLLAIFEGAPNLTAANFNFTSASFGNDGPNLPTDI